jgi:hypothetical protein
LIGSHQFGGATADPGVQVTGGTLSGFSVGAPDLQIACILYDGVVKTSESDEYVEIRNYSTGPQDLAGWKIEDVSDGHPSFTFPSFTLGPYATTGQVVRVYTNESHPETGGFSFGSNKEVWSNSDPDTTGLYTPSGILVSQCTYSLTGEGMCVSCQKP